MRTFLPLALALLAGCPDRTISRVNPEQGRVEYKDIPVTVNRDVDILFVVDNSKSMADKQANLAANFPNFINVLQTIPGGLPNVHIGVVTSDMGGKTTQDGTVSGVGGCAGSGDDGLLQTGGQVLTGGSYISDIEISPGNRQRNYTGDLATVFGAMAHVGDDGCGFEQHLEAMRRALTNPANGNFLRPDAYLAVIFIADEDDCTFSQAEGLGPASAALGTLQSFRCTRFGVTCDVNGATSDAMNQVGTKTECRPNESSPYLEKVQTYATFLKSLKPEEEKMVIVAGIMGNLEPFQVELRPPPGSSTPELALAHSCTYTGTMGPEYADPPVRLSYLLDQFPDRSRLTTICQSNLSDGLKVIADLLKEVINDPCIGGQLLDSDPGTPGLQPECSVSDVINPNKPTRSETILPACNDTATNKPCWRIVEDAVSCTEDDHLMLKVERTAPPPDGTHINENCVTEAI